MPNWCHFTMRVKGKQEDVERFFMWLRADYDYSNDNNPLCWVHDDKGVPCEHHIGARVTDVCTDKCTDDIWTAEGEVAWSVTSYMISACSDLEYSVGLVETTKLLNLSIELFSEEPGMCFSEHYYIDKGEIVLDDTADLYEYFIGDSYEEYLEHCKEEEEEPKPAEELSTFYENGYTWATDCEHFDNEECDWKWQYLV